MKPLTDKDKADAKARQNLKLIHNRIVSKFNFKEIKTWYDVYHHYGYTDEHINKHFKKELLNTLLSFAELKMFLQKEVDELESKLVGANRETGRPEDKQVSSVSKPNAILEAQGESKIPTEPPFKQVDVPVNTNDNNYCTVLALSNCLSVPYNKAKELLEAEGKRGSGMRVDYLSETLLDIGFELVSDVVNLNIVEAYNKLQFGKYILRTHDHALAIVDGVIFDHTKPANNLKIERAYRYTGAKSATSGAPVKEQAEPTLTSKDNYGYVPSPHNSPEFFAYWFQKKAATELKTKIVDEKKSGVLLLSGTGTGKTFIEAMLDRWLIDLNYHEGKTWSHIPRLCITKRTVVEQTSRVFKKYFNIEPNVDTEIINIEQLRSGAGQLWVKEEVYIESGVEKSRWKWKKNLNPCVVYFDESQGAKNKGSTQSQIIYAYNDLPSNTCLVSISATPFTRVSEAQAFAVSTHRSLDHLGFPAGTVLTNSNWPAYASIISAPSKPDEYNQAAIERLMKDLEDWVVRVRGVRPQFEAVNGVKIIPFESPAKRKFYEDAWERFLTEKAKLDAAKDAGVDTGTCQLVILLKFAMAAEMCHAEHFARDMYKCWQEGKAPVAAVKFKGTLIEIVKILNERYGVSRELISLIWGGGQTQLTKKQKAKEKVKSLEEKLKKMGIELDEMIEDMGLEDVEDRVIQNLPEHLRLGPQDPRDRQREIDNFQSGKTQFCLYTLKAGGVGLSLHHTDELTKFKCRRKESGYAVEEDIPKVPVRQRETFVVVTYNAIELVQGVGRVPRLTSLSPTIQNVYCYAGTVEVDMGRIYSQKLRCLSSVVKMHESWQDCIFGGKNRQKFVEETLNKTKDIAPDESTLIDEGDIEDEEDENGSNGK